MADVHVYGRNGSGGRNVGIETDGMKLLVYSTNEGTDAAALALAHRIVDREDARVAAEAQIATARAEAMHLRELLDRAESSLRDARHALQVAIDGRRRFFGPVLCEPASVAGWEGPIWLLDPQKRDRGTGLRFASLAELRMRHPELWIVRVEGTSILLDAAPLRSEVPDAVL